MRNAANRELLEENFQQCEHDYETALWMLYAIADDVIQKDNPFADQDRKTIGNCECPVQLSRYTSLLTRA
jgi:serine/threonine-protein kinase ULK2